MLVGFLQDRERSLWLLVEKLMVNLVLLLAFVIVRSRLLLTCLIDRTSLQEVDVVVCWGHNLTQLFVFAHF